MNEPETVSLSELLRRREERADLQREMSGQPDRTLLCFLVNMPGPVKLNDLSREIHAAGLEAIRGQLRQNGLDWSEERTIERKTGLESYFLVAADDPLELKRVVCAIENSHALGRLFDLDVLGRDLRPVSRAELGLPRRRCLICGQDGAACSRCQRHSLEELLACMENLLARSKEHDHG